MAQRRSRPETKKGRPFESRLIGRDGKKEGGETALWLLVRVTEHVVLSSMEVGKKGREVNFIKKVLEGSFRWLR